MREHLAEEAVLMNEERRVRRTVSERLVRVAELNEKYETNDYYGLQGEGQNYQVMPGRLPILVSAPHAVRQWRNGKMKERDGMTGGIVEYLCGELGTWGITRLWEAGDDPNYAEDERSVAYREEIVRIVKEQKVEWVLDVHGCLDKHGFDLGVGVNQGRNVACDLAIIKDLVGNWRQQGLDARLDEKFAASWPQTASNYVHQKTGANCLQLELSGTTRTTEVGFEKFWRGLAQNIAVMTGVVY